MMRRIAQDVSMLKLVQGEYDSSGELGKLSNAEVKRILSLLLKTVYGAKPTKSMCVVKFLFGGVLQLHLLWALHLNFKCKEELDNCCMMTIFATKATHFNVCRLEMAQLSLLCTISPLSWPQVCLHWLVELLKSLLISSEQ